MSYKPRYLPQISAPLDEVLRRLSEEGIDYELVQYNPQDLKVSQGIVFSNEVEHSVPSDENPIWVSEDDEVLDGHHRLTNALINDIPLTAVKLKAKNRDACRILNKIQDIYEYEQQLQTEEVSQDVINMSHDFDAQFLDSLEEDNSTIDNQEEKSGNNKVIIAYRKDEINENSVVGNFFLLEPADGYSKYEIEFDNLLDTNDLGISYKDGQVPIDILSKNWFPHVNFEKLSEQYNIPSINLKNKAIAHKAMKMGYDGIKYGDKLIQGLK